MHPFKILTLSPINTKLIITIFTQLNIKFILGRKRLRTLQKNWRGKVFRGKWFGEETSDSPALCLH